MKLLLESQLINITDSALNEVRRLLLSEDPDYGLRLGIKGGGCSGLSYILEFTEFRDGDTVLDYQGVSVYLDKKSTIYLGGITLDFQSFYWWSCVTRSSEELQTTLRTCCISFMHNRSTNFCSSISNSKC